MTQTQCPDCARFEVRRVAFRKDPTTGERVKRPVSKVLVLLITVPIGVMSLRNQPTVAVNYQTP